MTDETLKLRLAELDASHAFIAMHYFLQAAEHLDRWAEGHRTCKEPEGEKWMAIASRRLRQLAAETGKKAHLGVGDIT